MSLTVAEEIELETLYEIDVTYHERRKLWTYFQDTGPTRRELYAKHVEYFKAGATHPARLFCKANRVGGTEGMGCELTYHLTGRYPDWWEGKRFDHPITAWAAGNTNQKTKEIIQAKLFGSEDAASPNIGTGIIPGATLGKFTMRPGIPGAIQTALIHHVSGGDSQLTLKSFEMGHEAFQGNEVHVIWPDELCPLKILAECFIRIAATGRFEGGIIGWTVTPEQGLTDAIQLFMPEGCFPEGDQRGSQHYVVNATWDDVPHLSPEVKAQLLSTIPAYQLDARARGIPTLGAGVVYPIPEDWYLVDPFEIPAHWKRVYGMDVGWNWTAALWMAIDPETGTDYLYHEYKKGHAEPSVHAAAIKAAGDWIPGVIDPAANGRGQKDGAKLLQDYRALGLDVTPASNEVHSSLFNLLERLSTNQLKVFSTLQEWRKEKNFYRRDDQGHIVKTNDHLMDDMRYLNNSGRHMAKQPPVARQQQAPRPRVAGGWGSV